MKVRTAVGLVIILAAALLVGITNKQEVDSQRDQYCEMVGGGYWPDYHHSYKAECGGKDPPKFLKENR
ncbi:hypothetical protein [Xanthomonas phage Suba]|uniref:Uncharacterized protein n=1 Tax=Xanthomonas phage Suba TaxID=2674975 RepID=A0A679KEV3_9CAUD|nr:hypothetical protein QAY88_gp55 [Xanthomonas phage Suba]CAA2409890.1 hypothetical protein [Xanthomonas phage Suba]